MTDKPDFFDVIERADLVKRVQPPKEYVEGSLAAVLVALMEKHGRAPDRVLHVGSADGNLSLGWREFALGPGKIRLSRLLCRYSRINRIADDLVVVGADGWWLQRVPGTPDKFMYIEPPMYDPNASPFVHANGKQRTLVKMQGERRTKSGLASKHGEIVRRSTGRRLSVFGAAWGSRSRRWRRGRRR